MIKEIKDEGRYRLLTERSPDIIIQLSPVGTIEFISEVARRVLAENPSVLIGQKFRTLVYMDDRKTFDDFLSRVQDGNDTDPLSLRLESGSQKMKWLELSGRALGKADGSITGFICIARDITERKSIECKLIEACRRAEKDSATKSEFLRHVSHEFRTPLNAIMGFSQFIRDETFGEVGDPRYTEYARIIYESSNMLAILITNVLDFSKIEAGKYRLHLERVKLKDIVPLCVRQILPQAMSKNITIADCMSDTDIDLEADKLALTQILVNLLSNAVKFTPRNGRVELDTRVSNERICLDVSDTGIGIRQKDIKRIVGAFEQATDEPDTVRNGTGLGLALVKSLANLHQGDLTIESEPGTGTTFSVVLPRAVSRRAVAAPMATGHGDTAPDAPVLTSA